MNQSDKQTDKQLLEQSVEVTRTYLQITNLAELKPGRIKENVLGSSQHVRIEQVANCLTSFYRYLYTEVGHKYHWCDRLPWTNEQTLAHLAQPDVIGLDTVLRRRTCRIL